MDRQRLWTADELLALSEAERTELIKDRFVTDVNDFPPALLQQVQADIREHIARVETTEVPDR